MGVDLLPDLDRRGSLRLHRPCARLGADAKILFVLFLIIFIIVLILAITAGEIIL